MNSVHENPDKLHELAQESGLAVALVDESGQQAEAYNNNSMCRVMNPGATFSPACAEYCGRAFEMVAEADAPVDYECFAGLQCRAVPIKKDGKRFAAISGRAFLKAENYRKATERAISGDWNRFRPTEFFGNILMTGSMQTIEKLAGKIVSAFENWSEQLLDLETKAPGVRSIGAAVSASAAPAVAASAADTEPEGEITRLIKKFHAQSGFRSERMPETARSIQTDREEAAALRSLFGRLMKLDFRHACGEFLDFLSQRFNVESAFWFEIKEHRFRKFVATGDISEKPIEVGITADHPLFVQAAKRQMPLVLRERRKPESNDRRVLNLFPLTAAGEVRSAIGIVGELSDLRARNAISRISQGVASQLEILRLRDEVNQRDWQARAVRRFNESLKKVDADDFWLRITQVSAELLRSERASLLVRNEKSNRLLARAAVGSRIDLSAETDLGSRVARPALDTGEPVVVSDVSSFIAPAPSEWRYKSDSFITYPVSIGDRKLAVLNFTDRADGEAFDERDIELLQAIAPQIAMAIDRATLRDKAGQFEQLSVTDSLTGLLNRRYLQERLNEEVQRTRRHRSVMSVLMLDVDKFKSYNDNYGHPAGDEALRMVAGILKENLRGDDVAARYGGEEFAILLPQTTAEEAAVIAERIRRQIERTEFPNRPVTISIGIAASSAQFTSPDDIIWAADRALYEAKNRGRNNVQLFNDLGDSHAEKVH